MTNKDMALADRASKIDWQQVKDCRDNEYFDDRDADVYNHTCRKCEEGAYCVGDVRVFEIIAKFGYGRCPAVNSNLRFDMKAPEFEECPFNAACLGGENPRLEGKYNDLTASMVPSKRIESCNVAAGYRHGGSSNDSSLNATVENFLCHGCAPGYSHGAGSLTGKCYECPEQGMNIAMIVLISAIVISGLIFYVKTVVVDGDNTDAADGAKNIGLSFLQTVALLTTFPIDWPPAFMWVFRISGIFTVMGQHLVDIKCLYPSLSEGEVFFFMCIVYALLPPFICGVCFVVWTAVSHIRPGLVPVSSQNNDAAQGIREIPPISRSGRNVGTAVQASIIAILYLVWPGLCSETFAVFACRSFCERADYAGVYRHRIDLDVVCYEGDHLAYVLSLGAPMLLLYVIGLPVSALFSVHRLRRRAVQKRLPMKSLKGYKMLSLFFDAFRDEVWWWEGTMAARKIFVVMIGVFGVTMGPMQLMTALLLVVVVALLTGLVQPYGDSSYGPLIQRLEMASLVGLFMTLWASLAFLAYPGCKAKEGDATELPWCVFLSVIVGCLDLSLVVAVIVVYLRLKGVATRLDKCLGCVQKKMQGASGPFSACLQRVAMLLESEGSRQRRIRVQTVESSVEGNEICLNPFLESKKRDIEMTTF